MLCSVPAGKSGSNWLNRLRSNKGFPTGDDDLDLDHFLSQNPNSSASDSPHLNSEATRTIPTRPEPQRVSNRSGGQEREWVGVMNNVLSELFFMGGSGESSRLSGKKFPRKQTNPRICVVSSDNSNSSVVGERKKSSDGPVTASFNSDGNSPVMRTKEGNVGFGGFEVEEDEEDDDDGEEEEEKGEKELKGYSRSEVTVIDTSFGCWKSEKLVFRRKNVWKVREKKGKLRSFGRKKRKGGSDSTWGAVGLEKKAKVLASNEANGDQSVKISSDEGQNLKNDSMEEVCKATAENLNTTREEIGPESPDNLGQDFRRRQVSVFWLT
ncbi:fantom protein [Trema orientale]|uniref:Fantom protein n=1 Tax=Trema orientale TaxID=63057 RepID=A0A2P5EDQ3_TREOI|nr:fantom protein [Trema orientale]